MTRGFGIIGAGLIAAVHADAIAMLPDARLAEVGIRAAKAGKHLVVEKPVDVTLEAADRLTSTPRSSPTCSRRSASRRSAGKAV